MWCQKLTIHYMLRWVLLMERLWELQSSSLQLYKHQQTHPHYQQPAHLQPPQW